jgi:hypothetical protein
MNDKKIFGIGKFRVELNFPDTSRDLKYSSDNNINIYDDNGHFLWNISELLKVYSDKSGLRYYEDMYFDIQLLDNERIFCVGFKNHCEIDLKSGSITKIINNR